MAKHASVQRYCSEYDRIAASLGIPGRKRPHTVTATVNGLKAIVTIDARSQQEADALVAAALNTKENTDEA